MTTEEQRLIAAGQGGDVDAFNQLVRLYEGRVYNVCYRMLGDSESAADAAQDTFISAYRKLQQFRGGMFRSWILRIATNTCYDVLRVRKRRPAVSLDAVRDPLDGSPGFDPADQGEAPEDVAVRHELAEAIQQGLEVLPEDQRMILILSDIQGMAYEEIAQVVGINIGTVKSRLSRGRARLRDQLKAGEHLPLRYRHEDV